MEDESIEVHITEIAVYVKDGFDYVGSQILGEWNFNKNSIKLFPPSGDYYITNEDYQNYRNKTKKGKDFYWYSTLKIIDVSNQKVKIKL